MSPRELEAKLDQIRERALETRRHYTTRTATVQSDDLLSPEGKATELTELREQTQRTLSALEAEENAAITQTRETLERRVLGTAGTDPSSVISFRDAQERADAITDHTDATAAMRRALTSGDQVLAQAVMRRALEQGFTEASALYTAKHPDLTEAAKDLADINRWQNGLQSQLQAASYYSL